MTRKRSTILDGAAASVFERNQRYAKKADGGYQTRLSPKEQEEFFAWAKANKVPYDPSPTSDYDMAGFWKGMKDGNPNARQAVNANDGRMHFSDYWKTPYHESFSRESQWATDGAPSWNDKDQLVSPDGTVVYDERAKAKRK
jgi:hypothetical protein